jgi:hypothetical protein
MNFGEARHFLTLLHKAGSLDDGWLASWKETERILLSKILTQTPTYRLVLPFTQSATDVKNMLLPVLEQLVNS